MTFRCFL